MPPIFSQGCFKFEGGEPVPDHIEDNPDFPKDQSKFHLDGFAPSEGDVYPLARNIDDLPTAQMLHAARKRLLDENKTTSSGGTQDKVYIVYPSDN